MTRKRKIITLKRFYKIKLVIKINEPNDGKRNVLKKTLNEIKREILCTTAKLEISKPNYQ